MSSAIRNQATLAGLALAAGLAWTAFGTGAALAVSPSQQQCEAEGGMFSSVNGTKTCVFPDEQVANDNASTNNNSQKTGKTLTGQGNFTPKEGELNCSGPPGRQDPGCP